MKKLLLLALLPLTAVAGKERLIELEDKVSVGYMQTTNAGLGTFSYTSGKHFVHAGGMAYGDKWGYDYSSGSVGYAYIEDNWTAGIFYMKQSNDVEYLSLRTTKTFNLTEDLHITTGLNLAGLEGEGFDSSDFSTMTLTNSTYVLYNITDSLNVSGFYVYGGVDVVEGMQYSDNEEFRYGAIVNYDTDKFNITYSLSKDRDYGLDGTSNLLLASYNVLDSLALQGYYYSSTNKYVDSNYGIGVRLDF